MEQEPNSRELLRIHKDDNVLIVVNSVQPGDKDVSEGYEIVFTQRIAIGHKVASRLIQRGEKIYKCGVPIGSVNQHITAGAHILFYHPKRQYLETYTLDKERTARQ